MKFKKTSISLPRSNAIQWLNHRRNIIHYMPGLLARFRDKTPHRNTLTKYTRQTEKCRVISVYWPLEVYNDLHAVAGALRISVSHLLLLILRFVAKGGKTKPFLLNYRFEVISWSGRCMEIREILRFQRLRPPIPTPLTP